MGRCNFKVFNMWASHDNFLDLMANQWNFEVPSSSMYVLYSKLKKLKQPLKELGKLHFSHISEQVNNMEGELLYLQLVIQDDKDNTQLLKNEKKVHMNLVDLKSAEKMFLNQKFKCNYFKDCDRSSSFFHAIIGQKQRKWFIASVMGSNGVFTSSEPEVGEEFVRF